MFKQHFFLSVALPVEPVLSVGCDGDNDCPDYNACRNRKCINPCAVDKPCAPSAICKVVNHNAVCTCPNGFIGSPYTRCSPRKFPKDNSPKNIYKDKHEQILQLFLSTAYANAI